MNESEIYKARLPVIFSEHDNPTQVQIVKAIQRPARFLERRVHL